MNLNTIPKMVINGEEFVDAKSKNLIMADAAERFNFCLTSFFKTNFYKNFAPSPAAGQRNNAIYSVPDCVNAVEKLNSFTSVRREMFERSITYESDVYARFISAFERKDFPQHYIFLGQNTRYYKKDEVDKFFADNPKYLAESTDDNFRLESETPDKSSKVEQETSTRDLAIDLPDGIYLISVKDSKCSALDVTAIEF